MLLEHLIANVWPTAVKVMLSCGWMAHEGSAGDFSQFAHSIDISRRLECGEVFFLGFNLFASGPIYEMKPLLNLAVFLFERFRMLPPIPLDVSVIIARTRSNSYP
jgi:hypothetical protein